LRLQILSLLCTNNSTGYALKIKLRESFNRGISYGSLYPQLNYLERERLVSQDIVTFKSGFGSKRKGYSITDSGREYLKTEIYVLEKLVSTMLVILG